MSLLLTQQERDRFASWLEREATTSQLLIDQLEKLGPHTALLVGREKTEAGAALLVAAKLRAIQSVTIEEGPYDNPQSRG